MWAFSALISGVRCREVVLVYGVAVDAIGSVGVRTSLDLRLHRSGSWYTVRSLSNLMAIAFRSTRVLGCLPMRSF